MIVVKTLEGHNCHLPYYLHMRVGQFVTQVAAPALGCQVRENGDVYDRFVMHGANVFTNINKDKRLSEVIPDGSTLHFSLCLGLVDRELIGNGNLDRPTQHQLTLLPPDADSAGDAHAGSKRMKPE